MCHFLLLQVSPVQRSVDQLHSQMIVTAVTVVSPLSAEPVLANDPCTRLLDGNEVKLTGKNCPNYTIKEKMHGQLCKNWRKKRGSCLILAKTVTRNHSYIVDDLSSYQLISTRASDLQNIGCIDLIYMWALVCT